MLRSICLLAAGIVLAGLPAAVVGGESKTGFIDKVYKDGDGKEHKYVVFIPTDYKDDKDYPCILFLHGAGEKGTDGEKQAKVGFGKAIRDRIKDKKDCAFIAILPQAEKGWQANGADAKNALAILDAVGKDYKVDKKRVYLTGLSMGGFGTWSLAASHPDRWAAMVPVCGGGDPKTADRIKDIPCWCFHGDADDAVPVDRSRTMMQALWAAGGHPNYTEYPGVGHNSWDKAYATADLYEWLLKHQRKTKP